MDTEQDDNDDQNGEEEEAKEEGKEKKKKQIKNEKKETTRGGKKERKSVQDEPNTSNTYSKSNATNLGTGMLLLLLLLVEEEEAIASTRTMNCCWCCRGHQHKHSNSKINPTGYTTKPDKKKQRRMMRLPIMPLSREYSTLTVLPKPYKYYDVVLLTSVYYKSLWCMWCSNFFCFVRLNFFVGHPENPP